MVFEECPFCGRYVEVKLVSQEPKESGGYEYKCSYCKKIWTNGSILKSSKETKNENNK